MKHGPKYPVHNPEALRRYSRAFSYDKIYNWFQQLPSSTRVNSRSAIVKVPFESTMYTVDLKDGGRTHLKSTFATVSGPPKPTVLVISRRLQSPREWSEQDKHKIRPHPERPPIDYLGDPAVDLTWQAQVSRMFSLKAHGVRDQHDPTLLFVTSRYDLNPEVAEAQAIAIGKLILGPNAADS